MTLTYDADKCTQRNKVAAKRDGVNATPMRLVSNPVGASEKPGLLYAHGTLPQSDEEALTRINQTREEGSPELTLDDVHIHYLEAANSNFISDTRRFFLDGSTLRNAAKDAMQGVAFMNSHRTGSLSHPSELPMGRSFAGRYEQYRAEGDSAPFQRTQIAIYMRRGIRPNGDAGPSTDDMHAAIQAGTVFDVSVGLHGGMAICDVCGKDLEDCPHVPGTSHEMSREQQDAQRARGIKDGTASWTLVDAHIGEVSAVYDGAVPGAGFRKTLRLAKQKQLTLSEIAQARNAYASLLSRGDLPMSDEIEEIVENGFTRALKRMGFKASAGDDINPPPIPAPQPTPPPPTPTPTPPSESLELSRLKEQLAAQGAHLAQIRAENREKDATVYATDLVKSARLYAAGYNAATRLHSFLSEVAQSGVQLESGVNAAEGLALLDQTFAAVPKHQLFTENVPARLLSMNADPLVGSDEDAKAKLQAEADEALAKTPEGRIALARRKGVTPAMPSQNGHK